ncbi:hypothetical protein [Profundibacter sp.]
MKRIDEIRALADRLEKRLARLPRTNPRAVQSFAAHRSELAAIVSELRQGHVSARIHITPTICHMRLLEVSAESIRGGADMLRNWITAARREVRRQELKEVKK